MIKIIRNSSFCSKMIIVLAILISFLLAPFALAGQTGTEGGSFIPSDYEITAGGSVTMFLYQSPDVVIIGDAPPSSQTMTGQTTGSYPTSANFPGMYLAQGSFALERISISPASGYTIDDLIVGGTSQGAISAYDFSGTGPFTFTIRFKQAIAQTTTEQPTTKTTTEEPKAQTKTTTTTPAAQPDPVVSTGSSEVEVATTGVAEPVVADAAPTTSQKSSAFPYWWILLIILILLLLFLFFLLWKRRKKEEEDKDEKDKRHNKK